MANWERSQPGCVRDACFQSPLVIGNSSTGGKRLTFSTALAIQRFLPASGGAGVLTTSAFNPSSSKAGVFAGQLMTAIMNAQFSANLATLEIQRISPTCGEVCPVLRGMSILELIYVADQVIANQASITYWDAYTPACLNKALTLFNEAFSQCASSSACFVCDLELSAFNREEEVVKQKTHLSSSSWLSGSIIAFVVFLTVTIVVIFFFVRSNRTSRRA